MLYSGIPVKEQIRELGLLDPIDENGWRYKEASMRIIEGAIEDYVQLTVSRPYRDRIRTIEKFSKLRSGPIPAHLDRYRREMDAMCVSFVEGILALAEGSPQEEWEAVIAAYTLSRKSRFARYLEDHDIDGKIVAQLSALELPSQTLDLFRQ